jgi:hypothetical protein
MSDSGVWVKLESASFAESAAINSASSNYDTLDSGVVIDGKTYDIYTFTTPVTPEVITLTAKARKAIEQAELPDMESLRVPDDYEGDPADLLPEDYRNVVRDAFEVIPGTDPGLNLVVASEGRARILVVGGGGSGGSYPSGGICGGGGGAGEMFESDVVLPEGTLQVHVGYGGGLIAANWPANIYALSGGNATFIGDFAACGGGYGGGYMGYAVQGGDGGSGGGAGGGADYGVPMQGTVLGRPTGGNQGGDNTTGENLKSGGGGGAGSEGVCDVNTYVSYGGDGRETNITGTPQMMAAGGGGFQSPGGSGIGGAGIWLSDGAEKWASPPAPNTGSGGGAGYNEEVEPGSAGIVIVRVEVA